MNPKITEPIHIEGFPVPTDDDYRAADKSLELWPIDAPPGSDKYKIVRYGRASIRARMDRDKYDLYSGIRPPRNAIERIVAEFHQKGLSEEELRARMKADSERPWIWRC